jgi:hypothetical protein
MAQQLQGWSPLEYVGQAAVPDPTGRGNPQICVDSHGNTTAVWCSGADNIGVIQSSFKPLGGSWQTTPDSLSSEELNSFSPQIAVDGNGNVVAVWSAFDNGLSIVQASSKLFGEHWQPPITISQPGIDSSGALVVVDRNGNATAVWGSVINFTTVIQASSKSVGGTWQLSSHLLSQGGANVGVSSVAVDAHGNVTAVWAITGSPDLIQASTKPFGEDWQLTPDTLSQVEVALLSPKVAVDADGNATAVWPAFVGGSIVIQSSFRRVGENWQSPVTISQEGVESSEPSLGVDAYGNAMAVWYASVGGHIVVQAASKSVGGSWQLTDIISQLDSDSFFAKIAVNATGQATVVWIRTTGQEVVVQASSTSHDGSWQHTPDTLTTEGAVKTPQVVVDAQGNATAIWEDVVVRETTSIIQSATNILSPTITNVSPHVGSDQGGNSVTITGTNFLDVTAVHFGSADAVHFMVIGPTTIVAIAPPGSVGTVDITVVTSSGTSAMTIDDQYEYVHQQPLPPSHFRGEYTTRPRHKHKHHLKATWRPSPSANVQVYRVYKRSKVVATVLPSSKVFRTNLLWKSSSRKFTVAAIDSSNAESIHAQLKVK